MADIENVGEPEAYEGYMIQEIHQRFDTDQDGKTPPVVHFQILQRDPGGRNYQIEIGRRASAAKAREYIDELIRNVKNQKQ